MNDRTRIFVAHSFDRKAPSEDAQSDVDVATWFIDLLKHRPLNFEIVTGSKPVPARIDDKIKADIADCQCVVAVFTRKHQDAVTKRWLPSQFVLCEAASALGFYYGTNRLICGFYEDGLHPEDLALITAGGLELIPFQRGDLERDKQRFVDYLKRIPELLAAGSYKDGKYLFPGLPYAQQSLRKIYTIYLDGSVTVHNITQMLVSDAARFMSEHEGEIRHEIWNRRGGLAPLAQMIATSVSERRRLPFLKGVCRRLHQRRIDAPLRIRTEKDDPKAATFFISFYDREGNKLRPKNQDTIVYQYAWAIPKAYAITEEELTPVGPGEDINDDAYNLAEVVANHGVIRDLVVELRFERGRDPLFDKSPFYQTTASFSRTPHWSRPNPVAKTEYEDDHEMWYSSFMLTERNFTGRLKVLWRPASSKMTA
jgi:hypothetical protein